MNKKDLISSKKLPHLHLLQIDDHVNFQNNNFWSDTSNILFMIRILCCVTIKRIPRCNFFVSEQFDEAINNIMNRICFVWNCFHQPINCINAFSAFIYHYLWQLQSSIFCISCHGTLQKFSLFSNHHHVVNLVLRI